MECKAEKMRCRVRDIHLTQQAAVVVEDIELAEAGLCALRVESKRGHVDLAVRPDRQALRSGRARGQGREDVDLSAVPRTRRCDGPDESQEADANHGRRARALQELCHGVLPSTGWFQAPVVPDRSLPQSALPDGTGMQRISDIEKRRPAR